jgi:hypothetical protein
MNEITIETASFDELKKALKAELERLGHPIPGDDHGWRLLTAAINAVSGEHQFVTSFVIDGAPSRPGQLGMMIGKTRFHLNTKSATIAAAAVIVDLLGASGVASGMLTMTGHLKQSITRLNVRSGELCNAIDLNRAGSTSHPAQVLMARLAGGPCVHPDLNCRWRQNLDCAMPTEAAEENVASLKEHNVVVRDRDNWKVAF